jgi:hypothetical protein
MTRLVDYRDVIETYLHVGTELSQKAHWSIFRNVLATR